MSFSYSNLDDLLMYEKEKGRVAREKIIADQEWVCEC